MVDAVDHVPFALQALRSCYLVAVAKHQPRRLLHGKRTLQFRIVDLSAPMPQSFRQDFVIACHRKPFEDVILAVFQ